jgi:hypothetical protein
MHEMAAVTVDGLIIANGAFPVIEVPFRAGAEGALVSLIQWA